VKQVQIFFGFSNYYNLIIKNFSLKISPLFPLTKKGIDFDWNEKCQKFFDAFKKLITIVPILLLPDPEKPFILWTDAIIQLLIGNYLS